MMNIRHLIRECLNEAHVDADGNLVGFSAPKRKFQNGTHTNTANELLKWAKGARFTCDQKLADTNGDMRALFDMLLDIMRHQGRDLLGEFGEDEEDAFYDFAANYDKGIGYWKRMGEKIFGDIWGYGTGVDANPSVYDRFMTVSVDDDKVDEAVRRVRDFGWWCRVGQSSHNLQQTALIVSPVKLG